MVTPITTATNRAGKPIEVGRSPAASVIAPDEKTLYVANSLSDTVSPITAGPSHDQNFANWETLLNAFGKWKPEEGLTVHAFVSNLANGGYVLVEAAEPGVVQSFVSKFTYWNEIKVVPVVDVAEAVTIGAESLAWARAASNG
jgi:hypothetical protein